MDELAVNVYRREENAASLAVKFLKTGCRNIHLDILKADLVKRNKCAIEISIRLTHVFQSYAVKVLLTKKFKQHLINTSLIKYIIYNY